MAGVRFGPTVVEPPIGVCMLVTIGIESDTLITALWFSTTTTDALAESTIRCSEAKAFSRAMAESAFTVTAVSPGCGNVIVEGIATCDAATAGRTGDVVLVHDDPYRLTGTAWIRRPTRPVRPSRGLAVNGGERRRQLLRPGVLGEIDEEPAGGQADVEPADQATDRLQLGPVRLDHQ